MPIAELHNFNCAAKQIKAQFGNKYKCSTAISLTFSLLFQIFVCEKQIYNTKKRRKNYVIAGFILSIAVYKFNTIATPCVPSLQDQF